MLGVGLLTPAVACILFAWRRVVLHASRWINGWHARAPRQDKSALHPVRLTVAAGPLLQLRRRA